MDIDLGDTNDFELQMALSEYMNLGYQLGDRIYLPGTEYGGLIEDKETSTYEDSVFLRGYTWRGLLQQKIICPEKGQEKPSGSTRVRFPYWNGCIRGCRDITWTHSGDTDFPGTHLTGTGTTGLRKLRRCS